MDRCLICKEASEDIQRGLCPKHYAQWYRARAKVPADWLDTWEERLIDRGLLLPDKRSENPFMEVAKEVIAEKKSERVYQSNDDPFASAEKAAQAAEDQATHDDVVGRYKKHVKKATTKAADKPAKKGRKKAGGG